MSQFTRATPGSLADRTAGRVRRNMFETFIARLKPTARDSVLDLGATSDQIYDSSNYFETLYPFPDRITAVGIEDASFLEQRYPGVKFLQASAVDLPFADSSFDLVHSSAVLEHVGSAENQAHMVAECFRVARRGVCLTTPNRWFPIEVHTHLPLVHWLPAPLWRGVFRSIGCGFFAEEKNLNPVSRTRLQSICRGLSGWRLEIARQRILGWTSNLLLFGVANR